MQAQNATANVTGVPALQSAGILAYSAAIKRFDLLERSREQQLARRWQERRDKSATDELVTSHLRLAAKVARGYKGYGLPIADLIAEANLGLVIAASRFEPGHGARFSSYAIWWIKATVHEYILRSWSLVKIGTTAAQKKLFFRLRGEIRKLAGETAALTPDMAQVIAEKLEVTVRDVTEMDSRLCGDLSLHTRAGDGDGSAEWEATLVDESPDAEEIVVEHDEATRRSRALRAALEVLTGRERRVFEARRLAEQPLTLEQLSCELSISSERVRQIEASAFAKVKRATILAARAGSEAIAA
ncbi:RNA polymerase sigma factor RpoH [Bradyrhizobium sp. Bra64]|uniref:RNA polymerase sigma factor RpoH n=1 Tax=Bradyrhizobium sp. Bra64 TaxID=2926009 RepID=UPI002118D9AF|nr:RNA polymerase sigma factor RpoH [Bradyrhizobium sp. Bra64]